MTSEILAELFGKELRDVGRNDGVGHGRRDDLVDLPLSATYVLDAAFVTSEDESITLVDPDSNHDVTSLYIECTV